LKSNYKYIAWIYDWLAKLVFGNKLELAKKALLAEIPNGAKILIVGGGTGSIIEYLAALDKELKLDFVEQSKYMIDYAQKRNTNSLSIKFYNQSILDSKLDGYDVVITNFFFDQFKEEEALNMLQHIKSRLNPNGVIFFSDFINSSHPWDKFVTWFMFAFFKLTTAISAKTLPPFNLIFAKLGLSEKSSKKIGRNIITTIYSQAPPS
jgi:2-polyprenyl-3-methyl-5-hydroxy-6-metoxy-1,4-benzoquinol methylase